MSDDDGWTPYGLEAFRQDHLWRRRVAVAAVVLLLAASYVALIQFGLDGETTTTIDTFGGDGGSIQLERPEQENPSPDATLTLSPGELNVPDNAIQDEPEQQQAEPAGGERPGVEPINWGAFLVTWAVPLALLGIGYLLGRRGTSRHEVNYGVYKGAMPMETISARYSHLVETTRATYQDPFGKRRPDYVPDAGDAETAGDEPTGSGPDDEP